MQSPLIAQYLDGAKSLRQLAQGMTREQQRARPIAGRWSTLEVVCHVADMDAVFAERMKRVLAENEPTFFDADPDQFAAALAYHDRDLDEELNLIDAMRRQMGHILATHPVGALTRWGTHSTAGRRTLEQLLTSVTRHLVHHVEFIQEKRQALGLT